MVITETFAAWSQPRALPTATHATGETIHDPDPIVQTAAPHRGPMEWFVPGSLRMRISRVVMAPALRQRAMFYTLDHGKATKVKAAMGEANWRRVVHSGAGRDDGRACEAADLLDEVRHAQPKVHHEMGQLPQCR